MTRTPEQLTRAKERRRREATFPKCWCGNVAGVDQTLCGRHRSELDDPLVEVMEQIPTSALTSTTIYAAQIRAALEARGLEIRSKNDD